MRHSVATSDFAKSSDVKGCHAVIDNEVFCFFGPLPHTFPVIPSKSQKLDASSSVGPPDFYVPGWFNPQLPFLGFVPSSNPFRCNFLWCLDYSSRALPIERNVSKRTYSLQKSLRNDWDALEKSCRIFLNACVTISPLGFESGFRFWSYPLQYGYCKAWRTEADARRAATQSRLAFLPLIGAISYMLCILHDLEMKYNARVDSGETGTEWEPNPFLSERQNEQERLRSLPQTFHWNLRERLRKKSGISFNFLTYMEEILQISPVGVFVNVKETKESAGFIHTLLETSMPVVLYLGTVANWSTSWMNDHLPKPNFLLVENLKWNQAPYTPPIVEAPAPPILPTTAKSSIKLPRITGGPQPHPNKNMESFLQRRTKYCDNIIANESPKDRESRLAREQNAEKKLCPGKKGARVYFWDLINGCQVRTPAGRSNQEGVWNQYGDQQRRYDSVADEWDLCTEFDPDDEMDNPDDDGSLSDVDDEPNDVLPVDAATLSAVFMARNLPCECPEPDMPFLDALEDLVSHHFGYICPQNIDWEMKLLDKVWSQALNMLGAGRPPLPPIHTLESRIGICKFVFDLFSAKGLSNVPSSSDLSPANVHRRPQWKPSFEIIPLRFKNLSYHCIVLEGHRIMDVKGLLAIASAAAVLEIARRDLGAGNISSIVYHLLNEGIAFKTLVSADACHHSKLLQHKSRCVVPLGFRPQNYEYTVADFQAYENWRNEFLKNARGRAALMAGGLIARLARGVADYHDVLDGPTYHAFEGKASSYCLWDGKSKHALWDDCLTDEIDLICGTYKVPTGKQVCLFGLHALRCYLSM